METVNIIVSKFATFSPQNVTGLDGRENLARGQYWFQPIKFVNSVVTSPCETQPYDNILVLTNEYITAEVKGL